jgi:hypothetical protein
VASGQWLLVSAPNIGWSASTQPSLKLQPSSFICCSEVNVAAMAVVAPSPGVAVLHASSVLVAVTVVAAVVVRVAVEVTAVVVVVVLMVLVLVLVCVTVVLVLVHPASSSPNLQSGLPSHFNPMSMHT